MPPFALPKKPAGPLPPPIDLEELIKHPHRMAKKWGSEPQAAISEQSSTSSAPSAGPQGSLPSAQSASGAQAADEVVPGQQGPAGVTEGVKKMPAVSQQPITEQPAPVSETVRLMRSLAESLVRGISSAHELDQLLLQWGEVEANFNGSQEHSVALECLKDAARKLDASGVIARATVPGLELVCYLICHGGL